MLKLIMLVGISGAGKSTYVNNMLAPQYPHGFTVVSTDSIREELFGDAAVQEHNDLVFNIAYKRIKNALSQGETVVLDATSLSKKSRRGILNALGRIECEKEAHVILAPPEIAIKNQERRERQIPDDAVIRQMTAFDIPEFSESFDKIYFYNRYFREGYLEECLARLDGFSQTSPYHREDVLTHTKMVLESLSKSGANEALMEAARYHDIGKAYTRTGEDDFKHFYNHARVSAYLYLCGIINGLEEFDSKEKDDRSSKFYPANLIANHDNVLNKSYDPKTIIDIFGIHMYEDLLAHRLADEEGKITLDKTKETELLDLMNTYSCWEDILTHEPFGMTVKKEGDYILLKYNYLASDMDFKISRQARGPILKKGEDGKFHYVCRPFEKFFNYGEAHVADIDWRTARVSEKIDGALCKVWYDDGYWHLSTMAMIDAFKAPVSDTHISLEKNISYGDVFERALGADVQQLGEGLDKNCTYLFELTSPDTQIVILYPDCVHYLTRFDTLTGEELFDTPDFPERFNITFPQVYDIRNLEDALRIVRAMSKDEEGFVINDSHGHRMKIKSPEFIKATYLLNNKHISDRSIIKGFKMGLIDDFETYLPQYKDRVENIRKKIRIAITEMENAWQKAPKTTDRREFAQYAEKQGSAKAFLYAKYGKPELTAEEFLFSRFMRELVRRLEKIQLEEPEKAEKKVRDDRTTARQERE